MRTIRKEEIKPLYDELLPRIVASRWFFFLTIFLSFSLFSRSAADVHVLSAFLGLFFANCLISALFFVTDAREETHLYNGLAFSGYLADSIMIAVIIGHTGGFTSPFVIAYAYLITTISESGRIFNIVLYGIIFHISYALALRHFYGSFDYYVSPQVIRITALFAVFSFRAVWVAKKIQQQSVSIMRSKDALEHFAEGLKASNETLERLSYLDPVTGSYNFRYFRQLLTEELDRTNRYGTCLSLLIIDIDNFKAYNELFGHQRGDKVLRQVGELIRANIRELDTFARFIGDEFVLVLLDADTELAKIIANRIKKAIEDYPFQGEVELPSGNMTVSIGIAVYPESANDMEGLIKTAEDALYKVKLTRNNQIRVYSSIVGELRSELEDSDNLIETLQTLLIVVNARDSYTYGHSERVVRYALAIGEKMELNSEELRLLKYGAFLHDIGKIEINREVLNKREPLTDAEWDLIKQHPLFGISILEPIHGLEETLLIVRNHHERFDGRGYPDGLAGAEIPLMARILAVADSFDAMRSNRPYREALPKDVALHELVRGKGCQFDPAVVDAFLSVVDQVENEMDSLAG